VKLPPPSPPPQADEVTPSCSQEEEKYISNNSDEVNVFEEIISEDFLSDKYLQEIQKDHLEIIKLNNILERKIYDLGDSMVKVIKEKKVDLEDTKKILGWREVQDLIKDHYKRENVRKSWSWQGSWGSKFKRYIDGGTSSWFF